MGCFLKGAFVLVLGIAAIVAMGHIEPAALTPREVREQRAEAALTAEEKAERDLRRKAQVEKRKAREASIKFETDRRWTLRFETQNKAPPHLLSRRMRSGR